jgi:hypothetical protein
VQDRRGEARVARVVQENRVQHVPRGGVQTERDVRQPEDQRLVAEKVFRVPGRLDLPPEELPEWARDVYRRLVPAELDWQLLEEHGQEWMSRWDRTVRAGSDD